MVPLLCIEAEVCSVGAQTLSLPPLMAEQLVSDIISVGVVAKAMLYHSLNSLLVESFLWLEVCKSLVGSTFQGKRNLNCCLFCRPII